MKRGDDREVIRGLEGPQGGVFSTGDLRSALAEAHRAALYRRIASWVEDGTLVRCTRGLYVTEGFDPRVLSQRLAPDSALSFETVLADALVIGPRPDRRISAVRAGKSGRYEARGVVIEHRHQSESSRFGESVKDGLRSVAPEKAILDVLAFHLRGRRALFDLRADVHLDALDRSLLAEYVSRYDNPKFVAFAREVLGLS